MPLDDHAAPWSSYIGEVIRGVHLYYPSWLKVPKERKAVLITDIGTQFDLRPHMESFDWTEINAAFKAKHWVINHTTETYNVDKIRRARHENITASEWDKGRPQPLRSTRRLLTPSSWNTLLTGNSFGMRTNEMRRLEATGAYTNDEINRLAKGCKQRGYIPSVGRVWPAWATASLTGVAGEEMRMRVPTIRTTRMRMAMAILSCVIYGKYVPRGTYFLTGKYVGAIVSPGIVAGEGIPYEPGIGARAHGEVGRGVWHCSGRLQVYGSSYGEGGDFGGNGG
nr:F-box domain, leucine-rich repeat domain, L domain-like protein [Tanacetum cinerariifolium]